MGQQSSDLFESDDIRDGVCGAYRQPWEGVGVDSAFIATGGPLRIKLNCFVKLLGVSIQHKSAAEQARCGWGLRDRSAKHCQ